MIMAIIFGLAYMLVFSSWIVNDADSHIGQSIVLSNQIMGLPKDYARECESEGINNLFPFIFDGDTYGIYTHQERIHYDNTREYFELFTEKNDASKLPYSVDYMSFYGLINYIPLVLGILLARAIHLGFIPMLYLSRIFALSAYTYLSFRAIKRTPVGKYVFALFALLPTYIMAISSFTYDGVVLVASINFLASILYFDKNRSDKAGFIEMLIWAFLIGGIKGGASVMFILLAFIFIDKADVKKSFIAVGSLLLACALGLIVFDLLIPMGDKLFQFEGISSDRLSTSYMWEHPVRYMSLWASTLNEYGLVHYLQMFGTNPTNCDFLPQMILPAVLLSLVLPVCALGTKDEISSAFKKRHIIMGLVVIAVALIFTPAMLLRETKVDDEFISGIQGRYYLNLLPLAYLCLASLVKIKLSERTISRIKTASLIVFGILNSTIIYLLLNIYLER